MAEIKAILFDCDGVLLDSEPMGCEALALAITAAGRKMDRFEAAQIFSGNSSGASLSWIAAQGLDARAVYDHADRLLFTMFEQEIRHIPGIEAVLADFDVPMAVCSNSMIRRLEHSIARSPLAARFLGHIYSAEHVAHAKPAPDLAVFAAKNLGVAPSEAIFIDDNPIGLSCGVAAGCLAVGFVGPSDHRKSIADDLRDAGADYIVHGMAEFHALLCDLSLPLAA
ncbi:HAD-IA family hydrolase [Paracoccus sp. (in: a-proteobacteria)]|uniref:HAD family hydrolase n=1 Tax=Paracoccus sp. TaxID=267 RepID=UPI0028A04BD9|nr:HAD-IA family hydrolase [Paracoccus sp. (in: a-proteobacteria)]